MLDTVAMVTEHLTSEDYTTIEEQLQARYGVHAGTGELAYLHYTATIAHPHTGAQIRFQVQTAKWVKMPGEKTPHKVNGLKSLRIECSVHKAMHGHNVYGGATEPIAALTWLLAELSLILGLTLPGLPHWKIRRLDVAMSFDLGSLENVRGWIRAKSLVIYPRREVHFWGDLGFMTDGTTTTLRAYAKGPQFHKEGGYQALLKVQDASHAFDVKEIAERTLRCEVEIKSPVWDKLDSTADSLTQDYLENTVYEQEWRKFLRPIDSDSRMVHTAVEVEARLRATYDDPSRVLSLYSVWCLLAIRGEGWYRTQVAGSTWRTQRAALEKACISWESTNILTIDSPTDLLTFYPLLESPRRNTQVLPFPSERIA